MTSTESKTLTANITEKNYTQLLHSGNIPNLNTEMRYIVAMGNLSGDLLSNPQSPCVIATKALWCAALK